MEARLITWGRCPHLNWPFEVQKRSFLLYKIALRSLTAIWIRMCDDLENVIFCWWTILWVVPSTHIRPDSLASVALKKSGFVAILFLLLLSFAYVTKWTSCTNVTMILTSAEHDAKCTIVHLCFRVACTIPNHTTTPSASSDGASQMVTDHLITSSIMR